MMKTAIVFFSLEGNTRLCASALAEKLAASVFELKPEKPYPTGKFSKFFWGGKSATFREAPPLEKMDFDVREFDRVILGTPLWAGTIAPPLRTFLLQNDLSQKEIAAFICCGGGNCAKAFSALRELTEREELAECVIVNAIASPQKAEAALHAFCEKIN